jgi:hypothetical protein
MLQLLVRGRPVTVSTDRVKPAYILNETNRGNNPNPPAIATPATPPQPPTKTTCSGRHTSNFTVKWEFKCTVFRWWSILFYILHKHNFNKC